MMARITDIYNSLLAKARKTGPAYTVLDLIKLFAVVTMTVDHVGYYFFPENLWWRAVGHMASPAVWFFLAGYSRSRLFDRTLLICALAVMIYRPLLGAAILPVNVLVSICLCRLWLNLCEDVKLLPEVLPLLILFCLLSLRISNLFFEYGTIGVLYAMLGRMVREGRRRHVLLLAFCAWFAASYMAVYYWWGFDLPQMAVFLAGSAAVTGLLTRLRNDVVWEQWENTIFRTAVTLLSRNTAIYYAYHALLFLLILRVISGLGIALAPRLF